MGYLLFTWSMACCSGSEDVYLITLITLVASLCCRRECFQLLQQLLAVIRTVVVHYLFGICTVDDIHRFHEATVLCRLAHLLNKSKPSRVYKAQPSCWIAGQHPADLRTVCVGVACEY